MKALNRVEIIGNLGKEPEMRYTPNGIAVTSFSVAVNEEWGKEEGQQRTEWFACEAWNKAAEILNQYLHKGSKVYIMGRLQTDKWEKDGVAHYKTKLVVKEFIFLDGNNGNGAVSEEEEAVSFGEA